MINEKCPHIKQDKECKIIQGRGNPSASILVYGMNPGPTELRENKVFCGPSGKLLNDFLSKLSINSEVYIDNVVPCYFPIGTRPDPYVEAWREITVQKAKDLKPKIILALGAVAVKSLLPDKAKESIKNLRERLHYLYDIPLIVSYHPSAILRSGAESSDLYNRLFKDIEWAKEIALGQDIKIKDIPVNYRTITTKEDVLRCLEHLSSTGKVTALDFETDTRLGKSLWAYNANPLTVSLSQEEGHVYGFPLAHPESPFINDLPWLYSTLTNYLKDMKIVVHNASFENSCFSRWFPGVKATEDTLLMAKVLDEFSKHDLHTLTNQYTSIAKHKDFYLANPNMENDEMPLEHLMEANLADTDATIRIYNKFLKEMDSNDKKFYKDYLMGQFVPVVDHMIQNGIQLDVEYVRSIIPYYIQMEREFAKAAEDMFGININSPQQKANSLLELGFILPHTYDKKKKIHQTKVHSTDKEAMKHAKIYCSKDKLAILNFFERYNEVHYLNTYYLSKIFDWLGDDGRLHPWYNVFGAKTGRMSSQNPNAQNLKKKGDVKKMFKTDGYFVSWDYAAHEFRVFSMFARDWDLISKFREGLDVHAYHAALFYKKPIHSVTAEERQNIKGAVSFGVLFGAGPDTVSQNLGCTPKEAKVLVDWFKENYPSVKEYHNSVIQISDKEGYYLSSLGRKWRDAGSSFSQKINRPIQGTANYIDLLASYQLIQKGYKVVQNVHDSITVEFKDYPTPSELYDIQETCRNIILPGFEDVQDLWDGELSIGKNLGELVKL